MDERRSIWPALISGLAGVGMLVVGMALPWVDDRLGTELPWRAILPWDLAQPETSSVLTSIALPIALAAGLCLVAIIVRVRGLALSMGAVVLGLELAWFASESFRRNGPAQLVSQLELGAWLALFGALLLLLGAFLTPRWEPTVR